MDAMSYTEWKYRMDSVIEQLKELSIAFKLESSKECYNEVQDAPEETETLQRPQYHGKFDNQASYITRYRQQVKEDENLY